MIAAMSPADYWYGYPLVLELSAGSNINTRERRLSRSATLDGGSVFNDGGLSESDRTLTLSIMRLTREKSARLSEICAYQKVIVSLPSGIFLGRVKSHNLSGGDSSSVIVWVDARVA